MEQPNHLDQLNEAFKRMEDNTQALRIAKTEYPSLADRVQSTFIDTIFIIGMMFLFGSIIDKNEDTPSWVRIVLFLGLWTVYEPVCTSLGATIGNYLKGIRVRKYSNTNKKINILQALIRYILKITLGWISFLTIHATPEKRAIHDYAAGSIMILKDSA